MAASWCCAEAASKIAPYKPHAFGQLGVALFEVFDMFSHVQILHRKDGTGNVKLLTFHRDLLATATPSSMAEATTQSQANQSPKRA